jgi:ApbE superfamily uncharacterized protein (UPF0280 family)
MSRQSANRLRDGRLHLSDGPIDLIISCEGHGDTVARAEGAARERFGTILDELCAELTLLRAPVGAKPRGAVAQRMWRATKVFASEDFLTPMAAVAGAVAEEMLETMIDAAPLSRALVNNGGDIAFHLTPGAEYRIGLIDRPDRPSLFASADVTASSPFNGIATSGWRGRSFSLGIADAVTVLAREASVADAAATLIANSVDLPGSKAIQRRPAAELQPDSDLGERLVTVEVGALTNPEIAAALERGVARARVMRDRGAICGCALHLGGVTVTLDGAVLREPRRLAHA